MRKIIYSLVIGSLLLFGVGIREADAAFCEDQLSKCQQTCSSDACNKKCMDSYNVCEFQGGVDSPEEPAAPSGGGGSPEEPAAPSGGGGSADIPKSGKLNLIPKKFGEEAGYNTGGESLTITVGNLIKSFMGLLGILVVVIVVYAGFLWMTASGNEEKVGMAKRMITQATIGLILILLSYSIADFVIKAAVEGTTGVKTEEFPQ